MKRTYVIRFHIANDIIAFKILQVKKEPLASDLLPSASTDKSLYFVVSELEKRTICWSSFYRQITIVSGIKSKGPESFNYPIHCFIHGLIHYSA
jgi:hypothetical protein